MSLFTELPRGMILGNLNFVLCSIARTVRMIGYTGLSSQGGVRERACSANFLEESLQHHLCGTPCSILPAEQVSRSERAIKLLKIRRKAPKIEAAGGGSAK